MDELTSNGDSIDANLMEQMLGVPVVPTCASKGKGVEELVRQMEEERGRAGVHLVR